VYLEAAASYERQNATIIHYGYPAYVRGQAYLLAHHGNAAAAAKNYWITEASG